MIPVILLIAGLILWLATGYDTAGIILTIAGGVLVAIQAIFLAIGAAFLTSGLRQVNKEFNGDANELLRTDRRPLRSARRGRTRS